MVQRYFIELAYKGTHFHGWQTQPNAISVQECIEKTLSTLLRAPIAVTGAGRTDTGVHARYFVAHFDADIHGMALPDFAHKMNRFLNKDIVVFGIYEVDNQAHARFDALSRTYQYFLNIEKDPFAQEISWQLHGRLNLSLMNEACQMLANYTDFTSFSKLHTDVKTNNCKIYNAIWEQHGTSIVFTIKADRFLRNMVRAIVGTLLDVGMGKTGLDEFNRIIEDKNRGAAGMSVPAHGLFLTDIEYPRHIFERKATL